MSMSYNGVNNPNREKERLVSPCKGSCREATTSTIGNKEKKNNDKDESESSHSERSNKGNKRHLKVN
jgi:hypothetical protein